MRRITAPWPSFISTRFYYLSIITTYYDTESRHMSEKRTWDESRSPQWRYLLSKDSQEKRTNQRKEERAEQAEGELKKGISKHKRKAQERHRENQKLKSKSGKEIVYSASPGGENSSYRNTEFIESRHNKHK